MKPLFPWGWKSSAHLAGCLGQAVQLPLQRGQLVAQEGQDEAAQGEVGHLLEGVLELLHRQSIGLETKTTTFTAKLNPRQKQKNFPFLDGHFDSYFPKRIS